MGETNASTQQPVGRIFLVFLRLAPIAFGGGFAMISLFEREIVERRQWMSREKLIDNLAVAQMAPGAIGVNAASLIGFCCGGVSGAIAATVGMLIPTFLIMLLLINFFSLVQHPLAVGALLGIRGMILAMIASTAINMARATLRNVYSWGICIAAMVALLLPLHIQVAWIIIGALCIGLSISIVKHMRDKTQEG